MIIHGSVSGDEQVIKRLTTIPKTVREKLIATVKILTIGLQGYIVKNKLSGQVLKRKTGTLAASIQPDFTQIDTAAGIVGIVASRSSEGSPLKYAHVHEYGFHGVVSVRAHLRMQTMAFGRSINPVQVEVREHNMTMNVAERSYMRTSLAENEQKIIDAINKATGEAIK